MDIPPTDITRKSIMEQIALLPPEEQEIVLAGLDMEQLQWDWSMWSRPNQVPPKDDSWDVGLFLGGRGVGKTRAAAEWVKEKARDTSQGPLRFLLVARTAADVREVIVEGEALSLDTEIATPAGFIAMKDIKVGDTVLGGDGLPCTVTNVFPVLHNRPVYEVDVDGTRIKADKNHKWLTSTHIERAYEARRDRAYESVRTTEDIANSLKTVSGYSVSNHAIRAAEVRGTYQNLPIQPYTLGVWLGDGTSKGNTITSHDDDSPIVRALIESEGYKTLDNKTKFCFGVKTLTTLIKQENLYKNKHIPEQYFHASLDQRMALLRGLLDTDGCISERGQVEFTNTNKRLACDVLRLVSSLGIKAKITSKSAGYSSTIKSSALFRVRFRTSLPVFGLPRKSERLKKSTPRDSWRYVKSVTPVTSEPVQCITVDSSDHTFLITRQYIKTHNSGILAVSPPSERPDYRPSIRRLIWPNGNQAFCTSADEPDSLRGVQAHYSWGDEIAAWRQPTMEGELSAWDNLRIATRLGRSPQIFATTTPKRVQILFDLLEEQKKNHRIWVSRGSTFENAGNLSQAYLDAITGVYDGTNLARQELYGEMLDAVEGALWDDDVINDARVQGFPGLTPLRVIGVDPSVSENPGDECGIVVCAATAESDLYKRRAWVLEDASIKGSPTVWANEVVRMANRWGCPVVAETNQGGDLVRSAIHQIDPSVVVLNVHSMVGKKLRAEPVTLAYQQKRVHHVGRHIKLEEQMVMWDPEHSKKSPDRVDALVHALTALLIKPPKGFTGSKVRARSFADRRINTKTKTGLRPKLSGGSSFRIR